MYTVFLVAASMLHFPAHHDYTTVIVVFTQVASFLVVFASLQALVEGHGLESYFVESSGELSQIVMTSFLLGVVHTAIHAVILFRLRFNLMNVHQLKSLCLYKLAVNLLLPIFWFPEDSPLLIVDKRITIGLRTALILTYLGGYWFAGTGERVAKILVGAKAD
jgi:hypothetical protein